VPRSIGSADEPEPLGPTDPLPWLEPLFTPPPQAAPTPPQRARAQSVPPARARTDPTDVLTAETSVFTTDDACLEVLSRCDAARLHTLKDVSRAWWHHARTVLGDPRSAWRQRPIWTIPTAGEAPEAVLERIRAAEPGGGQECNALEAMATLDAVVELPAHHETLHLIRSRRVPSSFGRDRHANRVMANQLLGRLEPETREALERDLLARRKYDAGEDITGNPGEGEQQQQQGHWMHHGGQHVHVHFR